VTRPVVLIVDDNRSFVENLEEILDAEGYTVRAASSCADARELAASGWHVALVDVRLPDGDGVELGRALKRGQPDGEVILLTGFASIESAQAAVRAGAWAYLTKPCATPELLMSVAQARRHIDEKRALERRAHAAERLAAIGQLTAGLSHEIRNPLNAASLQLAVLERRVHRLAADVQRTLLEPLAIVQSEIQRLNGILEEFLQYARPRELGRGPVHASALVDAVVELLRPQAEAAKLRLVVDVVPVPLVRGDAGRLQQSLMNLVLNAIQAAPPGGWVRVAVVERDENVELSVEDNGPGVPDELRERIFEPFFTTKTHGSGLGLPLVHSIVHQHGGALTVESGADGGARFVMRLPRA
jgi:signal transduction histidine kinase